MPLFFLLSFPQGICVLAAQHQENDPGYNVRRLAKKKSGGASEADAATRSFKNYWSF
jgi:hypothetical protein